MNEPNRDDVIALLDREIDLIKESVKATTFQTWVLLAALAGLLALLANSWEAGGQDWKSVACIVLGFFMVGDAIQQMLKPRKPSAPALNLFQTRRLHIGIPTLPIGFGIIFTFSLLALLIPSNTLLPTWTIYLGAFLLSVRATMLVVTVFFTRRQESVVSFTDPKTPKWMLKPQFVKGYARGYRGGRGFGWIVEPICFIVFGFFAFQSSNLALPGSALTDLRFGFLVYAVVCIINMLLHPTPLQSLPGLVTLRRDLLAGGLTPTDAYIGVTLAQSGVVTAPAILVGKQRVTAMANDIQNAINESPELLENFNSLSPEEKKKHPLFKQINALEGVVARVRADIHANIAIRPNTDPTLLGVLAEMEQSIEQLRIILSGPLEDIKEST